MAPFDSVGFAETKPEIAVEPHDLTTPRGRLLYLRDVVVPGIPVGEIDMGTVDCGTHACLLGWYMRRLEITGQQRMEMDSGHFGVSTEGYRHLFMPVSYGGSMMMFTPVSHAELTAHINDVLEGRVK